MIIYYNAAIFSSNVAKHGIYKSVICKLRDASIFIVNFIAGLFRETRIAIVFRMALLNASHLLVDDLVVKKRLDICRCISATMSVLLPD